MFPRPWTPAGTVNPCGTFGVGVGVHRLDGVDPSLSGDPGAALDWQDRSLGALVASSLPVGVGMRPATRRIFVGMTEWRALSGDLM